ncbi:hypothetical protein KFE98_07035 [bacterium SCSIO 12741]|nr:hypothetical protein KFE98_07035 [bacterium SCSIO 12741]
MKKLLLIGSFIWALGAVQAQDETMHILENDHGRLVNDTLWTFGDQPKLMVVPFKPMMYKSSITSSIGRNDGTSYDQIVTNFRRGLDNLIYLESNANYQVVRMIAADEETQEDLHFIYRSLKDEYRELPDQGKEDDKKIKLKLNKKKKVEEDPGKNGTYMQQGQIRSNPDGKPRFMACSVRDTALFDYLEDKYSSVLYLIINQIDIEPQAGLDYRAFEGDEYQRQITVHYSIFTHDQEVYAGVVKTYFSSTVNGQKEIIQDYFPSLAQQLVGKLPVMTAAKSN